MVLIGRQTYSSLSADASREFGDIKTNIDDLEPLLQQLLSLLGEVEPHSLHRRCVGLVNMDIPNGPAEGRLRQIRVFLAPDRVVKDKDTDGAGPIIVLAKSKPKSVLRQGYCVWCWG